MPSALWLQSPPAGSDPSGMGWRELPAQRNRAMSKEKNKGNKETKKPKKEVVKVLATANAGLSKDGTTIAGKRVKQ